jgi:small-conductance mechanosensitive channel
MQMCSKQAKHVNSTSRLSDILNVISVKLRLIILMVCLQFIDTKIGNVLAVNLNGVRVGYTVQSEGQGFQEENT